MFQPDWAQKKRWAQEKGGSLSAKSYLDRDRVEKTMFLHWEEHCIECFAPHCYKNCQLYMERTDKNCSRFVYGIYFNRDFSGLFNFGADIRFRRWGKLEAQVYGQSISVLQHRIFQNANCIVSRATNSLSDILQPVNPTRTLNRLWASVRRRLFETARITNSKAGDHPDEFVLEGFSPEERPYKLILEYIEKERPRFRHAFYIAPGPNFHVLAARDFNMMAYPPKGKIAIYPEGNVEPRIILTWLDFVKYKPTYKQGTSKRDARARESLPAPKVKCVAWDLDNTLWEGTLIEDGIQDLKPKQQAIELINSLDRRGIVQTVVSKNDFADAWKMIEGLGLQDYFLYPAIHWGPKSDSLIQIAKRLNIGIDTVALIDDSPFERQEVQSALPQVRVYPAEQIGALLSYGEFDVPVTEMSMSRRLSYLAEIRRENVKESFSGSYEAFLRQCEMELCLFIPEEKEHILRCLELIQRSNQLNLSGRRYTAAGFADLLATQGMLCVALACKDKFGDYGIVGFAHIDETKDICVVREFVISCRVAQKRVEHTFFKWLARRQEKNDKNAIRAEFVQTEKNKLLFQVFLDMSFEIIEKDEGYIVLNIPVSKALEGEHIMSVKTLTNKLRN